MEGGFSTKYLILEYVYFYSSPLYVYATRDIVDYVQKVS